MTELSGIIRDIVDRVDEIVFFDVAGDIHQKNANTLGCSREIAKMALFAFAYGADGKQ